MNKLARIAISLAVLALAAAGCGGAKAPVSGDPSAPAASPASSAPAGAAAASLPAGLDQGARAGEAAVDEALAEAGELLFKSKGCSACHAFGKRVTCPDLAGVTQRRTAAWIESQILHPEVMVKQDPTARQLFAQYMLQMPNQKLTPDEARAVTEFFKHQDHEAKEGHVSGKEARR